MSTVAYARVDYAYQGGSTMDFSINLEQAALNQLLAINTAYSMYDVQEIGTLFILDQAPWGCLESHIPAIQGDVLKTTLEGKGVFYDGIAPTQFPISSVLVAEVVPFVKIGGQNFFLNTDYPGFFNGAMMELVAHPDGSNYLLDLSTVPTESFELNVLIQGEGGETVSKSPDLIAYGLAQNVTLQPIPSPGSAFDGWEYVSTVQAIAYPDGRLVLTILGDTTVIAKFKKIQSTQIDPDVNHDGLIDATDVQIVINAALGRPY